jgi:hypothetical protein
MPLIQGHAKAEDAATGFYTYPIDGSLRLNDDDSAYLSRTPASAGNRKTWTWSGWVKRGNLGGSNLPLFAAYIGSGSTDNQFFALFFGSADNLRATGYATAYLTSTSTYRDTSAWYHIVCTVDTTNATANNRIRFYVNGVEVTAFSTRNNPSLNADLGVNQAAQHEIGQNGGFGSYLDAYLTEVNFIDGTALDPTSFGEFKSGVWIPKAYEGSYGTNGFYLPLTSDANDDSGNGNNWTANNLASTDYVLDSPTNNFCTLNPLVAAANSTYSEGNLKLTAGTDSHRNNKGTFQIPNSGKWYYEFGHYGTGYEQYGIVAADSPTGATWAGDSNSVFFHAQGNLYVDGSQSSYGSSLSSGDIVQIAIDFDNGKFWAGKNGTWFNSGNPATGTNAGTSSITNDVYVPHTRLYFGSGSVIANFGQDSSFAGNKTAQGNTDDNGYGDFYYAPPSGYLALCTANLPDPVESIDPAQDGSPQDHFNTVLYTGNGSTSGYAISGVGFAPEFTWIKDRTGVGSHLLCDVVRGSDSNGQIMLSSNQTTAESSFDTAYHGLYGGVNSLDSDGFTVYDGSHSAANLTNGSGYAYVAWNWKANGSGVSNTDGSITSTVSANTDAGFSIVSYTGTYSAGTVGHGLSQPLDMLIVKDRDAAKPWPVWVTGFGATGRLFLEQTTAKTTNADIWGGYAPDTDSNRFYVAGNDYTNNAGEDFIAYCFHSVDGFSKFGSYTGNGSSDGPFVYTGFRPAFVIIKRTDSSEDWFMWDNKRLGYNGGQARLKPHSNTTEYTANLIDIYSNGFKHKASDAGINISGSTYIYMAFAENPFKYANAR